MIGRKKEIAELNELYESNKAELVAIYGRRRVGKTYLVDEMFCGRITFRHAGLSPIENINNNTSPLKAQLQAFYYSLLLHGMKKSHCPKDWLEAFFMLEELLQSKDNHDRQVVFLDELPWLDTAKSGFITAFESFWNTWGCHRKNLMVIVCGSANSWILDKLINSHGGLYNRVTHEIKLEPFSLKECEECLESKSIKFSRYDITQSYMILGGIPFYLNYLKKGKSLTQNINDLFFSKNSPLSQEYDRLFASVFNNPELMKKIVEFLATKSSGFTRNEIIEKTRIPDGGMLSQALKALIISDFIVKYVPFGYSKRQEHYKLTDPFCIFYIKFVKNNETLNESFWLNNANSQSIISWRGLAFENVCFKHINQIKTALGIIGVTTRQSAWSKREDDEKGAQIDLIIERKDNIVNMCEIKYYSEEYTVSKDYDLILRHRLGLLQKELSSKQVIHSTLITTFGLKYNSYSGIFTNVITLEDLFK